jgi:hypothetical protein
MIKDLDNPFDGSWTVTNDEWEHIAKKAGVKPSIIFVYNIDNTATYKLLARVSRLFSRQLCPLFSLMNTSDRQLQAFVSNLEEYSFVRILYRDEFNSLFGEDLKLPTILYESGSKIQVLLSSAEISESMNLGELEKATVRRLEMPLSVE